MNPSGPMMVLSYAREDRARVEALYGRLVASGYKPWMDSEDIVAGEDWARSISRAINRADFFVACLSENSFAKRGYLQREILEALDKWREKLPGDVYLIPVKLEQCDIPERLSGFQAIELFRDDGLQRLFSAFEIGIKRLERKQSPNQGKGAAYRVMPNQFVEECPSGEGYRMAFSYPQIVPETSPWAAEVNIRFAGWVAEQAQNFRECRLWSMKKRQDHKIVPDLTFPPSELSVSYSVRLFTVDLLSVEFTIWFYGSGAAHGNTSFKTVNLLLNPPTSLFLGSIFRPLSGYLPVVSALCRECLCDQDDVDIDWVERGTLPEYENFKSFSLTADALRVLFPPYQVGPFSSGPKEVTLPYTSLESLLDATGPLRPLLQ